jgi:hypothetical protein
MSKYDSIYFLHVMKTGGRHLRNTVFIPIINELKKNNIKIINENHGHSGWHSEISDKTYIVTSLRDPVQQVVSLYAHGISLSKKGKPIKKFNASALEKDIFLNAVSTCLEYQNFQSKSYLHDQFDDRILNHEGFLFDENLYIERKNRVNLILNMKDINNNEIKIQEKIFLDLQINGVTNSVPAFPNAKGLHNPESKKLYNKLSSDEKKFIRQKNSKDEDLYNNSIYFDLENSEDF